MLKRLEKQQIIEILKVTVNPEHVDKYLETEHVIWTKYLEKQPGFLGKDVWLGSVNKGEIRMIIYWNSLEEWKAIPGDELAEVERIFQEAFGEENTLIQEHEDNLQIRIIQYP